MALIDEPYLCKSNGILEYITKEVVAGTESEYCEPEFVETISYIYLSIEQTRNSREMEQAGSAADILYMRGRLVRPRKFKGICWHQQEFCFKWKTLPGIDAIGTARVTPEVSSRLGLESVFGSHVNLEVQIDNMYSDGL